MESFETHQTPALSFGSAADTYERGRPLYPPQAIDWLLPSGAAQVLDLGAGTGKLTRQLRERGLDVIAVEPSAGMRAQFAETLPDVPILAGTAEEIPLSSGTVDAVLVAQAWHWVDPARAVPEVTRVLRPGGRLGVLWNTRDERTDWVAELSTIMHDWESGDSSRRSADFGPPLGAVERHDVAWAFRMPTSALTDYVASRSYIISLPGPQREEVLNAVRHLIATHPALAGTADIGLPQVTECYRADLPR